MHADGDEKCVSKIAIPSGDILWQSFEFTFSQNFIYRWYKLQNDKKID